MNHGTILLCEALKIAASQRAILEGLIFVAKASPKFRCSIYCMYFIDRPGKNDVEVRVTHSLESEKTIKFLQRGVAAQDMERRGYDSFCIEDHMMVIKAGRYWFDLIVNGEIVSSSVLTVY